jgi:hypothetical protein
MKHDTVRAAAFAMPLESDFQPLIRGLEHMTDLPSSTLTRRTICWRR